MNIYGNPMISMDHGYICLSIDLHEYSWVSVGQFWSRGMYKFGVSVVSNRCQLLCRFWCWFDVNLV